MALKATKEMCLFCFEVLEHALFYPKEAEPATPSWMPDDKCLLFVTWRIGNSDIPDENDLRGCKGSISNPKPLGFMLRKFSLNSAFEDSRFSPITKKEFPKLLCEISLLHSFEKIDDYLDWEVGVHGIDIDFDVLDSNSNVIFSGGAIFLPTVAPQFGWDQKRTIIQLIKKAGYKGKIDFKNFRINATRHQSSTSHVTYKEYKKYVENKMKN